MRERAKTPIKRICDARGIKYAWMAGQLGVSASMFDHIESFPPRRKPPADYYARAAAALNVPADMLMPESEPETATV